MSVLAQNPRSEDSEAKSEVDSSVVHFLRLDKVPETNSEWKHLKIGLPTTQKETRKYFNHPFLGA